MQAKWPRSPDEAVNICFLTLTDHEKGLIKYTPQDRLIWFHFDWAMNMRNEFGMWHGNSELIESCWASDPDGASMAIVEAVWQELNR
jgi:hypothetical protein